MTAVEFLVEELNKEMGLISFVTGTEESYKSAIFSIIQKAKEMEKKQLYNFYMQGGVDAITEADRNVEQYYNETFKSE